MRAYFFGNMYLSPIQQGIQAAHVVGDMAVKYRPTEGQPSIPGEGMFWNWAENHKVMILLNAGYGQNILELEAFFEGTLDDWPNVTRLSEVYDGYSPYPFAMFSESDEALGGAATSFGVVLPPAIYNGAQEMRKIKRLRRDDPVRMAFEISKVLSVDLEDGNGPVEVDYNQWEIELMERLGTFRLA